MALTNDQLQTLSTAINAETDPVLVALLADGNLPGAADWYNELGTFTVWRTDLSEREIVEAISPEATTWDWDLFIATSVAEKQAWERIFGGTGAINPSLDQTRLGISAIFSGPQYADQRAHLLAIAKQKATRAEALFATGTGTIVDPGKLVFQGFINYRDIQKALAL